MKKKLTEADKIFIIRNSRTMTRKEFIEKFNVSKNTLNSVMKELGMTKKKIPWTIKEIEYLKENYKTKPSKEIAEYLDKSIKSIHSKAYVLKLKRESILWTKEEEKYLIDNFGKLDLSTMMFNLNRNENAVKTKIRRLDLIKSSRKPVYWTKEEEKYLIDNFGKLDLSTMMFNLNRNENAVKTKIANLQLVKFSKMADDEKIAFRTSTRYCSLEALCEEYKMKPKNIKLYSEYLEEKEREESKKEEIIVTVTEKKCSKCGEIKKAEYFNKNRDTSTGLSSWCTKCKTEKNKKLQLKKLEKQGWY